MALSASSGRATSGTVDTNGQTFSFTGHPPKVILVKNSAESETNLLVRVPVIHGGDQYDTLEPGDAQHYAADGEDLTSVVVKAASGTPTAIIGVVNGKNDS